LLLNHVLSQIYGSDLSEICEICECFDSNTMDQRSWDRVKSETIHHCLKTCGITVDDSEDQLPGDAFADICTITS